MGPPAPSGPAGPPEQRWSGPWPTSSPRDALEAPQRAATEVRTVRDLMECWMGAQEARGDLSPRTVSGYRIAARHVAGVLGDVQVDRVGMSTVERYRDERLRAGGAPGTAKMELGVLRMAWIWGREVGVCPARDLPRVSIRVKPARNQRTPPLGDVLAVLEHLDGWPRLAVVLMMGTGARIREIAHLRWKDVGLDAATIRIRESKTRPRTLPVAEDVVAELRQHGPGPAEAGIFGVLPETGAIRAPSAWAAVSRRGPESSG